MKPAYKVLLINISIVILLIAMLFFYFNFQFDGAIFCYALAALSVGGLNLVAAIALFIAANKYFPLAKSLLLSSGILLVTGFVAFSQVSFGR